MSTANNTTAAERRRKLYGAIFARCKQDGLDQSARRQLVKNLTGCESMTDCSLGQLKEIASHLNRGKKGYEGRQRVRPSSERAPLLSKVDALLAELHRVTGEVKPLAYADGIARRVCKRDSLDFCEVRELTKIVAALGATLRAELAKRVI